MLQFAALEQRLARVATQRLSNVNFWWQAGGTGGTADPVLVQGIFDREPADQLGGMAESFNPVLMVSSELVPGAARGDTVEIDAAQQDWFATYFGQLTPRFTVVRPRLVGVGLVALELSARA